MRGHLRMTAELVTGAFHASGSTPSISTNAIRHTSLPLLTHA